MSRLINPLVYPCSFMPPSTGVRRAPYALLLQGQAWDYDLTEVANRFSVNADGTYTCQINDSDGTDPWRTELIYAADNLGSAFPYNTAVRFDWQMVIDEDWPVGVQALPSTEMLFAQIITAEASPDYSGASFGFYLGKGRFIINREYEDGSPPDGASDVLSSWRFHKGNFNISLRVKPHVTSGCVELWVNDTCVAAHLNVPFGLSMSNGWYFKNGIYRWLSFTGSLSVKVSDVVVYS